MNLAMFDTNPIVAGTHGSFPKFNPETVEDIWADSIVDDAGYASIVDLVLSRHEHVEWLFPSSSELRDLGVDVVKLATCLQEGLIVREFFNDTVNNLSVEDLNGALEHLLEGSEAYKAHPDDALDRSMHYAGCCHCNCRAA